MNTGRSGCQKTLARRSARREERVTVQDPVQKQDGDEMAQGGGGSLATSACGASYAGVKQMVYRW